MMNRKVIMLLLDVSKIFVKDKGKILICLENRKYRFISNGCYVPITKNNILSLD